MFMRHDEVSDCILVSYSDVNASELDYFFFISSYFTTTSLSALTIIQTSWHKLTLLRLHFCSMKE